MAGTEAVDILTSAQVIGIWVQALLTFAILSFLIKDNAFYKFAEHIFVGISAGYGVVLVWHEAVLPIVLYRIFPSLGPDVAAEPNYWVLVPSLLGLMMISRFIPRFAWLSRWPMAFVVGVTAGYSIPQVVETNILAQMSATVQPLVYHRPLVYADAGGAVDLSPLAMFTAFNNLLLVLGVVCVLSYFYFSREHKGLLGASSRLGIWFLMVAFGAGFGNTVMARISLLIGRVQFLIGDWWEVVERGVVNLVQK